MCEDFYKGCEPYMAPTCPLPSTLHSKPTTEEQKWPYLHPDYCSHVYLPTLHEIHSCSHPPCTVPTQNP